MADTMHLGKDELIARAKAEMQRQFETPDWSLRERLALTCRILFDGGHDSGLAGQITARAPEPDRYFTQRLGLGFDEITASNLLLVDEDLRVQEGGGMPNPANRFHSWIYRARPDVNCIIHTHPLHAASLSMLEVPLEISHMDNCPLYDDVAFLKDWPGVPVGNEEGEIISAALGDKRCILLANHGFLAAGSCVEEALYLSVLIERAARNQLQAAAAYGEVKPVNDVLAAESHDFLLKPSIVRASFAMFARRVERQMAAE